MGYPFIDHYGDESETENVKSEVIVNPPPIDHPNSAETFRKGIDIEVIIIYVFVFFVLAICISIPFAIIGLYNQETKTSKCEDFVDEKMNDLPVRCIKFYIRNNE